MTTPLANRQKITLVRDWGKTVPQDLNNVQCDTPTEAVILSLFSLDNVLGNTLDEIQTTSASLCPEFSSAQIEQALLNGIKTNIFRKLDPIFIDWGVPLPPAHFTFSGNMDRSGNLDATEYLIGLVGGVCGRLFKRYFHPPTIPQTPLVLCGGKAL